VNLSPTRFGSARNNAGNLPQKFDNSFAVAPPQLSFRYCRLAHKICARRSTVAPAKCRVISPRIAPEHVPQPRSRLRPEESDLAALPSGRRMAQRACDLPMTWENCPPRFGETRGLSLLCRSNRFRHFFVSLIPGISERILPVHFHA